MIAEDKRARLKSWIESGEASLHPLSFPQRELWEASAVPVGDAANHICCVIRVRGLLTPKDCEAALRAVVTRQEALRLSFLPGREQPLQLVRKTVPLNLAFRDANAGDPQRLEDLTQEIFDEPFDLRQGPLYRAVMLRFAADDHLLAFAIHHAIADGWSLGVFVHDLFGAYLQGVLGLSEPLPPVPLSYTSWSAAERAFWSQHELEQRATFWRSKLAGTPRLWTPANPTAPLRRTVRQFAPRLREAALDLARKHGATLFSTLLAAFQIAASKWSGHDDIVVGTPVANRGQPASRETMGYCAGTVPLRGRVEKRPAFREILRAVHETTVDSFANAIPFVEMVRLLGEAASPQHHPVFAIRFALQNHPIPDITAPTLSAKLRMRSTGTARFDLGCEITEEEDGLELVWLFRPNMFSESDIMELHRLFEASLTHAVTQSELRIAAAI